MESIKGLSTGKKILWVSTLLVVVLAGVLLWNYFSNPANVLGRNLPVIYGHSWAAIDYDNPRATVGDADYVFVGEIKGVVKTEYLWESKTPYTNYEVEVLMNIKGELVLEKIVVRKLGGIAIDQKNYYISEEGDFLPLVGDKLIFVAYAQTDGSLLVSGRNSNISFASDSIKRIGNDRNIFIKEVVKTAEYSTYKDAAANQIESSRIRYISKYDVSAKK